MRTFCFFFVFTTADAVRFLFAMLLLIIMHVLVLLRQTAANAAPCVLYLYGICKRDKRQR